MRQLAMFPTEAIAVARLGAQALRTRRQRFLIRLGYHPLALVVRKPPLRLHADAVRNPENRADGPRCAGCAWYGQLDRDGPGARLGRCWIGPKAPRVTRGAATTVRKWWPACVDFLPFEVTKVTK